MSTRDDDIKAAEKRGYANGYQAGNKRKHRDAVEERRWREERAFRDRAFLAALAACVDAQNWTRTVDGKKTSINNVADRTRLAWDFADEAVKQRRGRA
jgi:hypothetical protein